MYNKKHEKNNADFVCNIAGGWWMRGKICVTTPEPRLPTQLSGLLKIRTHKIEICTTSSLAGVFTPLPAPSV